MNGNLAQIIALTCHGNQFLQGEEEGVKSFLLNNSTCQYYEYVKFVEWNKDENDEMTTTEIAGTPNEWFTYLKSRKAVGMRIFWTPQNKKVAEDRYNTGFVGGGGIWEIITTFKGGKSEPWRPKLKTCENHAPGKTWGVIYGHSNLAIAPDVGKGDMNETHKRLIGALENIKKFSEPHECLTRYTERFSSALKVLVNMDHTLEAKKFIYHDDLYPEEFMDKKAMALLSACQMVHVFGGMGSWNDPPYHDGNQDEYDRVSDELYLAMIEGFVVATNSSLMVRNVS